MVEQVYQRLHEKLEFSTLGSLETNAILFYIASEMSKEILLLSYFFSFQNSLKESEDLIVSKSNTSGFS